VRYSGRTLYLLPDGLAAQRPYTVLAQAMQQRGQWGLGRVVLSSNRQLVLLRPAGRLLAMDVLHYPAQVRGRCHLEAELAERPGSDEELRLAALLIDSASRPPQWDQFRDDTADRIRELVEAKIEGRPPQTATEEPVQVLQLLEALKQSVAAAGKSADNAPHATSAGKHSRRRSA
jgi:DNA end-binding protein Ku